MSGSRPTSRPRPVAVAQHQRARRRDRAVGAGDAGVGHRRRGRLAEARGVEGCDERVALPEAHLARTELVEDRRDRHPRGTRGRHAARDAAVARDGLEKLLDHGAVALDLGPAGVERPRVDLRQRLVRAPPGRRRGEHPRQRAAERGAARARAVAARARPRERPGAPGGALAQARLAGLDGRCAVADEQVVQRDPDRARLGACAAQRAERGQPPALVRLHPREQRREHRADRARVHRAVGVASDLRVDRARVEAGSASDAREHVLVRGAHERPATGVDDHDHELLRAVVAVAGRPGDPRDVARAARAPIAASASCSTRNAASDSRSTSFSIPTTTT